MVVTDDDERHDVEVSPAAATALLALCASPARLMWDPESRTVIAGGIRGTWFERAAPPVTRGPGGFGGLAQAR